SAIAHYGTDDKGVYSDATVGGIDVAGSSGASATALAFRRQVTLLTKGPVAAAAVKPAAADSSALAVDSAVAHPKRSFSGSVLTVHAESALKGVSLGGGAVHLDAIFSSSTSKSDGQSVASHEEKLVLTGVTAGGQPAAIDQTGVHIGGNSTSVKPLNDALASALGHAGITISALPSLGSVTSSGGQDVQSNVQGLLFTVAQYLPIPNATDTYFLTVTLGSSGTHLTASSERVGAPAAENGGIGGLETAGGTPAIPGTAGAFI